MFKNIAEDIVFYLSRKKILNQDNREIYVYALEVVLLNFILLMTLLIISLFGGQHLFFVCYLCFFVPLRVFTGGYHAKKSETCFVMSVASYVLAMILVNNNLLLFNNEIIVFITALLMFLMFLYSPIENINHPLEKARKRKNKIIARVIVLIDFTLLIVFYINEMAITSYEIIFILLNGVTFSLGKIENYIERKNRSSM